MEERPNGNENAEGGKEEQRLTEPFNCYSCNHKFRTRALLAVAFLVLMTIIIVLSAGPHPPAAARCCPDGWVRYLGQCYYFSEAEGDWSNSQRNCSSFGASLAVIDTRQEMAFINRHKGTSELWIGLRREPGQPWKWTNGTEFNKWFVVRAQGECAYLNDEAVTSSWCDTVRYWICSQPAGRPAREESAAQGHSETSDHS